MEQRKGVVTFGGGPVTLNGKEIKVGDKAPEFTAIKNDLSPYNLSEDLGNIIVISVVPSIDTGVCELQTINFNQEASKLDGVKMLTISCDLPFAQGRFCAAKGIDNLITLSDHRDLDFGLKYGFVIDELRLLSRGVVVIDKDGTVKYVEYVKEVTTEPDYVKALEAVKSL
ncbi:MAG: thiol peroxidase [Tissierellia bacterium]|nr:thiol peroxidase [Tissierellia bacterium]